MSKIAMSTRFTWQDVDAANPLAPISAAGGYPIAGPLVLNFPNGTAVGDINLLYIGQVTVPESSSAVIDLTSLVGPLGEAVDFARVIGAMFYNNDPTAVITIGGGTDPVGFLTSTASYTLSLYPMFPLIFGRNDATGFPIASGTNNNLKFTNGASNSILVDVILFGRVA